MNIFQRRLFAICTIVLCYLGGPIQVVGAEVVFAKSTDVALKNGQLWRWQITQTEGKQTLNVRAKDMPDDTVKARLKTDISECTFCSGEGDNCGQDGVKIVQLCRNHAVVQLICHVGAHSQRLMIFDPQYNQSLPVFERTGLYWIRAIYAQGKIKVTYDKSGFGSLCPDHQASNDGICNKEEFWP